MINIIRTFYNDTEKNKSVSLPNSHFLDFSVSEFLLALLTGRNFQNYNLNV